jgi:hypothetical protein
MRQLNWYRGPQKENSYQVVENMGPLKKNRHTSKQGWLDIFSYLIVEAFSLLISINYGYCPPHPTPEATNTFTIVTALLNATIKL